MIPESLQRERDGDQAKRRLLTAHPIRPAVRRITRHPVLQRGPEKLDVTVGAVAQPGADEGVGPGEAGELPDALDVVGPGIGNPGPMATGIEGTAREDVARPAIRPADLDELMREDPGVAAGEGVRLGDRRRAGFDRPGLELRGELRPVEQRERETGRVAAPCGRVEADREFLPRTHRGASFPDPELTLARPARAPEEPARTEVDEERQEHGNLGD